MVLTNIVYKFTFCVLTSAFFIQNATAANEQVKEYPATLVVHNMPFHLSSSREPNKSDDNELILLEVGQLLNAK